MKHLLLLICLSLPLSQLHAQKYDLAVGPRLGTEIGLSAQYRISKKATLETILHSSFLEDLNVLAVIYEDHQSIIFRRFNFYSGLGPHFGWYDSRSEATPNNPVGLTALVGIEITLGRFNISWDYKPMIHLSGGKRTFNSETAITLRRVFIRRRSNFRVNFWKDINWPWKKER